MLQVEVSVYLDANNWIEELHKELLKQSKTMSITEVLMESKNIKYFKLRMQGYQTKQQKESDEQKMFANLIGEIAKKDTAETKK